MAVPGQPHRDSDVRRIKPNSNPPVPGYGPDWLDQYRETGNYCVAQLVPDPNHVTDWGYLAYALGGYLTDPVSAR